MRDFDYRALAERSWDTEILAYLGRIYEYKGRAQAYTTAKPQALRRLTEIAKIQSTQASNQIEGIVTTNARLKQLLAHKTRPKNRSEQEILGYRNVLNLIHESYEAIPLKPEVILQLHRDLLKYAAVSYGGAFKTTANEIAEMLPDGKKVILFQPLSPYETPEAMLKICSSYHQVLTEELLDPLILIPCFILDFLCIHPFYDGNGRMSRLLTLLLLYRSGFFVGRYISIEKAIADTKEAYYDALAQSNEGWHEGADDPKPFIKYLLAIIVACYKEFEERLLIAETAGAKSTSYDIVRAYVLRSIGTFSKQDALEACPSLGSSSVEAALKKLVEDKTIVRMGAGRNTHYARRISS